jgi:hypothetical protein
MTQVTEEAVLTQGQLVKTIDAEALTLADWIALSEVLDFKIMWAYNCWINATKCDLTQLSIDDWLKIGEALERSDSWALGRYKEHKPAKTEE